MKVLVVGAGSIGTRHIENLAELGHEVYAVDLNAANLKKVADRTKGTYLSLEEALAKVKPEAAFICTFSNQHLGPARACAAAGCHLFIEKPLAISLDGVAELAALVKEKKLVTMVGCNLRFHPAVAALHEILTTDPEFKRILWANLEFGFFLPFAKKDYEKHYMANRKLGGNLIFDAIHELDYAVWFFGEPVEVICDKGMLSNLKMDTEDHVELIVRFKSGAVATIHLDYLQHGYSRRCKVVSEAGTVVWDFAFGRIGTISVKKPEWAWQKMELEVLYNQMYVDEIKYFLACAAAGRETFNSIEKNIPVLKLALAADRAAAAKKWERI
ncbi:MAG: Gfo/Idh/MocA family oxidoreductase [Candidatus Margulisiibacteriota bacterium]